jgi:hypothetical protein
VRVSRAAARVTIGLRKKVFILLSSVPTSEVHAGYGRRSERVSPVAELPHMRNFACGDLHSRDPRFDGPKCLDIKERYHTT